MGAHLHMTIRGRVRIYGPRRPYNSTARAHNIHRMKNLRALGQFFSPLALAHTLTHVIGIAMIILQFSSGFRQQRARCVCIFVRCRRYNPALILRILAADLKNNADHRLFYEAQSWFVEFYFLRAESGRCFITFFMCIISPMNYEPPLFSLSTARLVRCFMAKKSQQRIRLNEQICIQLLL